MNPMKSKTVETVAPESAKPVLARGNEAATFEDLAEDVADSGVGEMVPAVHEAKDQSEWLPSSTDALVEKINQIAGKALENARKIAEKGHEEIGELCLKEVFNYNLTAASDKNPRKLDSFNAICKHRQLRIHPNRLGESVKAAGLTHLLNELGLVLENLSFTHKLHLARIPDRDQRIALAVEANEKKYSVSKLTEIIALTLPKGDGGIGKAIVKAIAKPNETRNNARYMTILKDAKQLSQHLSKADRIDLRVKSARARQEFLEYCDFLQQVENSLFDIEVSERGLPEGSSDDDSDDDG